MRRTIISTFLYLVTVSVSLAFSSSRHNVITIAPTSHKPIEVLPEGTQTLSYYVDNSNINTDIFNTSNTTVNFLPGSHVVQGGLDKQLIVKSVNNIVWRGVSSDLKKRASIFCVQGLSLVFSEVINLTISDIEIRSCGSTYFTFFYRHTDTEDFLRLVGPGSRMSLKASLILTNSCSIHISNILVDRGRGYGLLALNIMRNSTIDSSVFSNNNYAQTGPSTVANDALGGNALFRFSNRNPYSQLENYLLIKDCLFSSGNNNYREKLSLIMEENDVLCMKPQYETDSFPNGLGFIMWQYFSIDIMLENVTFFQNSNSKNKIHPSVLILEDSASGKTRIQFSHCSFSKDGTLSIHAPGATRNIIIIHSSSFDKGKYTAIAIFLSRQLSREILIINCTFVDFEANLNSSILHVEQWLSEIPKSELSCFPVNVRIEYCTFEYNKMSCSRFDLVTTSSQLEVCTSVTINSCIYKANYVSNDFIVLLKRKNYVPIMPWERKNFLSILDYKEQDMVKFLNTQFVNNSIEKYSFKGIVGAKQVFGSFCDCSFANSIGTAVQAEGSVIRLCGSNQFSSNIGREGGAISLLESRIHLSPNSSTLLEHNKADYGGGLFIIVPIAEDNSLICVLSLNKPENISWPNWIESLNITVTFLQNNALYFQNSIFFNVFKKCFPRESDTNKNIAIDHDLKSMNKLNIFNASLSDISSLNINLHLCNESNSMWQVTAFPGANFTISLKAKGIFSFIPSVSVSGRLCNNYQQPSTESDHICEHDYTNELQSGASENQIVTQKCSDVTFSVNSRHKLVYLEISILDIKPSSPSLNIRERRINRMVKIHLLPCPIGFRLTNYSMKKPYCDCIEYLSKQGVVCDINQGGKVLRQKKLWVGLHYDQLQVIAHTHCPFDYCEPSSKYISLTEPNKQCNFNRGKLLCGACQANLSLVLGTSNCTKCSNTYLFLIIPFAVAGVALVILLLKCNLTVSTGHINGIIFFANIVHINKSLFFQNDKPEFGVFTTFIAWLNLDLGIETCFFEKMDTYSKVWLQFAFPVYLWIMICLIILLAHYSTRAASLIGSNSVPVLATLLTLSYAKLLRTIIAAVSFTFIEFENKSSTTVWLYDANVRYFSLKHSMLFIAAVFFTLAYIIPLTLLFLCSPCLQSHSHKKLFRWVGRIKPFLDANQGPYSDKFRWWSGLLLILRIILYSIYALNYHNDPSTSFFWTNLIMFPVSLFCLTKQTVYRHKVVNYLESISLLNVVVLCTVNWFTAATEYKNVNAFAIRDCASCTSVTLSMTLFLLILFYQAASKLCLKKKSRKKGKDTEPVQDVHDETFKNHPTRSVVELQRSDCLIEPLLDSM